MQKHCLGFAVLISLFGCATGPHPGDVQNDFAPNATAPEATASAHPGLVQADVEPVAAKTFEIREFDQPTKCEEITRPGSRIVIATHCYTPDPNDPLAEAERQQALLVREELRREQENFERMEREREMVRQQILLQRSMMR